MSIAQPKRRGKSEVQRGFVPSANERDSTGRRGAQPTTVVTVAPTRPLQVIIRLSAHETCQAAAGVQLPMHDPPMVPLPVLKMMGHPHPCPSGSARGSNASMLHRQRSVPSVAQTAVLRAPLVHRRAVVGPARSVRQDPNARPRTIRTRIAMLARIQSIAAVCARAALATRIRAQPSVSPPNTIHQAAYHCCIRFSRSNNRSPQPGVSARLVDLSGMPVSYNTRAHSLK